MSDRFKKVYIESGIKNRKDIKFRLAYTGESILLMRLDYIWGGDAKYETIKSYPSTMNVDEIVKDVKETIAKSEPIKGSSIGDLMRKNRKDKRREWYVC